MLKSKEKIPVMRIYKYRESNNIFHNVFNN